MRAAFGTVLRTLQEGSAYGVDASLLRLIDRTPSLSAELLRRAGGLETRLAEVIAEREGIHTGGSDMRPQLMVAVFVAAGSVAMRGWCGKEDTTLSHIGALLESALHHMGPELFGDWRSGHDGHVTAGYRQMDEGSARGDLPGFGLTSDDPRSPPSTADPAPARGCNSGTVSGSASATLGPWTK
ncbi:hypothetical protein ACFVYE_25380 [Streptomyces sp. NPDC058239]|uniref:acyl-CoA-like ligand-binding transcription factor n=1 Tax=unclassified Streptomyces TaxID=2593676 RepID=UPI0036554CA3